MRKGLLGLLNEIWNEGKIPEVWKTSIIAPLCKREDKDKTKNYREISLLCTACKIYAEILKDRLEKEVEEKKILQESGGF